VNPQVRGETGMDLNAAFVATALAAALGTLVMGPWARYPVALAPGPGPTAFFAFPVVLSRGIPWQTALACPPRPGVRFLVRAVTLVSGVLFFVLAVTGLREAGINAIPLQLERASAAGIGLFIAFIGLRNAQIVVDDPATAVSIGDLTRPETVLACFGVLVTAL